ncbi:MAG: RusA family crossover junction endodeoxyribonuclease [Sphingomonas sp.]|uniref:RusA family crossover junction endodeoxyribonuclease n=1 Tax=Sphingomonas sp. TaxID=28214 RepID=UPI0025D8442E|nr:RusA family crossover junction endodeoxyribonuclease [Sphingomonas sp.]MBQ1497876.1 RusA family crossover junction endodeoxyribonuclease [Sphingomonas sp.]
MTDEGTPYPLEVIIQATPKSLQAKHLAAWKERVAQAGLARRQETCELPFLDERKLAATIFYFPSDPMVGDVDNIVKPILDSLKGVAYLDDQVIERVTVQKFEPDGGWEFLNPSDRLTAALDMEPPVVYIRIGDDLSWRRVR